MAMKAAICGFFACGMLAAAEEPVAPPDAVPIAEPAAAVVAEGGKVERPAPPSMVVSRSGQFRVSGGDGAWRGMAAAIAEEARDQLLRLTEAKDDVWKYPILIVLHGKEGDAAPPRTVAFDLNFNDQGFLLRVDLHLARGIDREILLRDATKAMIYERALRDMKPGPLASPLNVPPWLLEGLREAVAWREQRSDRRMYEAVFKRGGLYQVDELLALSEEKLDALDAPTRDACRVSSGALVMALLEQPQGKDGYVKFLNEVAAYDGEMPILLRKHFPGMNLSASSLAKWWQLQLANMAAAPLGESLTIEATEAGLNEALQLHLPDGASAWISKPMSAWREVLALNDAERQKALFPAADDLTRLSYRCFPSYRPLIAEYLTLLGSLGKKEDKHVEKRLFELSQLRTAMLEKKKRAVDFLDWFEITRARETSGEFEDYLQLKQRLDQQQQPRVDPLSDSLNRFDKIFDRGTPQAVKPQVIRKPGKAEPDLGLPPE